MHPNLSEKRNEVLRRVVAASRSNATLQPWKHLDHDLAYLGLGPWGFNTRFRPPVLGLGSPWFALVIAGVEKRGSEMLLLFPWGQFNRRAAFVG